MELRIKEICQEKVITITELSEKMNISKSALSQVISGNPTVKTLENIAEALNVPFITLFDVVCPMCGMKPTTITILEYILQFIENKKKAGKSIHTCKSLYNRVKQYGNIELKQVDEVYINGFADYLSKQKGIKGKMINPKFYIREMNIVLNSAKKEVQSKKREL